MPQPYTHQALHDLIEADTEMGFKLVNGNWKQPAQIVTLAETRNRTPPQGLRRLTVGALRGYMLDKIDGTGTAQRTVVEMLRELAEAGTVRTVAPGSGATLAARVGVARHFWSVVRFWGVEQPFPMTQPMRDLFLAISEQQIATNYVFSNTFMSGLQDLVDAPITWTEEQFGVGHTITVRDVENAETLRGV